jgi:hypothetical protein
MCALLSQTVLTGYIINNARTLSLKPKSVGAELQWKAQRLNYFTIPAMLIFLVIAFLVHFPAQIFNYGFVIWAVIMILIRRKLYPDTTNANNGPLIARLFKRKGK